MKTDLFTIIVCEIYHDPQDLLNALVLTQVFSLKIHGLSPACYRNRQSSNCLILPHERNLII